MRRALPTTLLFVLTGALSVLACGDSTVDPADASPDAPGADGGVDADASPDPDIGDIDGADVGVDPGPPSGFVLDGACTAPAAAEVAFGFLDTGFSAASFPCGTCVADPAPETCLAGCDERPTGVADACLDCVDALLTCTAACPSCSSDTAAAPWECVRCASDRCLADFHECAGLPDGEADRWPLTPELDACVETDLDDGDVRAATLETARSCADTCLASTARDLCTTRCMLEDTALPSACVGCYGHFDACATLWCPDVCTAAPLSEACIACASESCGPATERCAGLDLFDQPEPQPGTARTTLIAGQLVPRFASLVRSDSLTPIRRIFDYGETTVLEMPAGAYGVSVTTGGVGDALEVLADSGIRDWRDGDAYSVLVWNDADAAHIALHEHAAPNEGQRWRFYNASGTQGVVDVRLDDSASWPDIVPGTFSEPVDVTPGDHVVTVDSDDDGLPDWTFDIVPFDGPRDVILWFFDDPDFEVRISAVSSSAEFVLGLPRRD